MRIVGAVAIGLAGVHTPGSYGWLFAIAPWFAVGVSSIGWHRTALVSGR